MGYVILGNAQMDTIITIGKISVNHVVLLIVVHVINLIIVAVLYAQIVTLTIHLLQTQVDNSVYTIIILQLAHLHIIYSLHILIYNVKLAILHVLVAVTMLQTVQHASKDMYY